LGISLVELATGKFPYSPWKTPFEQVKQVVVGDPPRLPPGRFSPEFEDFVSQCLQKVYSQRSNYQKLLEHKFLSRHAQQNTDVAAYFQQVLDLPDESVSN